MRILFLATQDINSPSGLGRYFPLAKELSRLGHVINIVTLHPNFSSLSNKFIDKDGVSITYVSPMHVLKKGNIKSYYSTPKLINLISRATINLTIQALRIPADIVHICKPHPMNSIAGLIKKTLQDCALLLDCDDHETASGHFQSDWQKKVVNYFETKIPIHVDYVTTNTYFTQERLKDIGVNPNKIFYLPNGVDLDRFRHPKISVLANLRSQLGLNNKKVIGYVGSLSKPSHPVELLFDCFEQVRKIIKQSRLLIVGGGDEYNDLINLTKERGIEQDVIFAGFIDPEKVVNYYHLMDVSIDPVKDDDAARGRSPLKLFESWACGVPYVSADVGDRRRLLGNPTAGLLSKPEKLDSFVENTLNILKFPKTSSEISRLGKERIKDYYWDYLAKDIEILYQNSINKK